MDDMTMSGLATRRLTWVTWLCALWWGGAMEAAK